MKKLISNYTFDASAQTVTSSEFLDVREIGIITNVTDNTVIYSFADPTKGGTFSGKTLTLDYDTTAMDDTDKLQIIALKGTSTIKWSFAQVVAANGVDTNYAQLRQTGSGMAVSQAAGNLVITTGTTAYSETIIRTNNTFSGSFLARYGLTLSQRIANQNFVVEMVDVVGDGLALTINSTTSVTVTKVAHGFTTQDIGKGIWISQISVASCLTQRAVIASIPTVDTITLTVVAFPASGSGTCSLVGYNSYNAIYSGTTATSLGTGFNTQRNGWQNTITNASINTTASGHIGIVDNPRCLDVTYLDQVVVTGTGIQTTARATVNQNVPDEDTQLYLQIRVFNGSTAPASTTTATFSFLDIQMYELNYTAIGGNNAMGSKNALPVVLPNTSTVSVSNTIVVGGSSAIDGALAGNPIPAGGRASSARPTAMSADNDVQAIWLDRHGAPIVELGAPRALKDQQATTITSSTSETTIVTAVASVFMDLHGLILTNTSATACNVTIKDATAGTTRMIVAVPAGETRGFMLPSTDAHKQAAVNNNWTATCSASVASIIVTAFTVRRV